MKYCVYRETKPLSGQYEFLYIHKARVCFGPFSSRTFFFPSRQSALDTTRAGKQALRIMSAAVAKANFGAEVVL